MIIDISQMSYTGNLTELDKKRFVQIVNTRKGTIPLIRDFGLSNEFVDLPVEQMKALFSRELIVQVKKYLPGKKIKSIQFSFKDETLVPKVVIVDE